MYEPKRRVTCLSDHARVSDPDRGSGDLGEGSREDLARLRLPTLQLRTKRVVSVVEHVADLGCVSDRDNEGDLPKLGFHDLRHTFASHLIRAGVDPVRASRQLGHARPSITLDIYAHEFEHARGLDDMRDSIDAAFGPSRI